MEQPFGLCVRRNSEARSSSKTMQEVWWVFKVAVFPRARIFVNGDYDQW